MLIVVRPMKKNKDVKELAEAIKTLPPEIIELYNTMLEKSKNEK